MTSETMSECVNGRELRVIGMSRSGNHAVINWIIRQASGRICFLNCVEPKTNPFETARPMGDGSAYLSTDPQFSLSEEVAGHHSTKDWLIYNYEDCFLGMVTHDDFESRRDRYVGTSCQRFDLLILRDPFNLFASRMKAGYSQVTPGTTVRIWKQHAREFCERRHYLPRGRIAVSFNRWATDEDYRKRLAVRLGLPGNDAGFEEVPKTGGGSSFDATRYHGRASRMRLQERWRHFADDAEFLRCFDDEVLDLSHEIFGPIPGTEKIVVAV